MYAGMGSHRPRLLLRFAVTSAVAIALLGVVLIAELRSTIRGQALEEGRQLAELATRLKIQAGVQGNGLREARRHLQDGAAWTRWSRGN